MSTRATYQIQSTVFYLRYDGYPTGAAPRFAQMVAAYTVPDDDRGYDPIQDRRGGWEFAFIRGNLDAEPTEGHDAHGDTEYRYTLTTEPRGGCNIRVDLRNRDDVWVKGAVFDLADWLQMQRGALIRQLSDFYAKYPERAKGHDPEAVALESIPVIVRIEEPGHWDHDPGRIHYATLDSATKITVKLLAQASRFQEDNPNKAIYLKRWQAWRDAITPAEVVIS